MYDEYENYEEEDEEYEHINEEIRNQWVKIRVNCKEKTMLKEMSERLGLDISSIIRHAIYDRYVEITDEKS